MKTNVRGPGIATRRFAPLLIAGLAFLTACASGTIDDAVPHAGNPPAATSATEAARGTGQFPNLNLPRKAATAQFTAAEQQQQTGELATLRQANETVAAPDPATTSADQAALSKLGQTEPQAVLKEIESGQ
ncbi:MAG: hypothetical protein EPN45_00865 [Rhizobiaceae bacterium]|nr:MAG: hypothetical protein EPN45_00865 [Rhizobiaceae bacterium]